MKDQTGMEPLEVIFDNRGWYTSAGWKNSTGDEKTWLLGMLCIFLRKSDGDDAKRFAYSELLLIPGNFGTFVRMGGRDTRVRFPLDRRLESLRIAIPVKFMRTRILSTITIAHRISRSLVSVMDIGRLWIVYWCGRISFRMR